MPKATKLTTVLILLGAALGSPAFMRPNYTKRLVQDAALGAEGI